MFHTNWEFAQSWACVMELQNLYILTVLHNLKMVHIQKFLWIIERYLVMVCYKLPQSHPIYEV